MAFRAVVFDFGGVLGRADRAFLAEVGNEFGLSLEEIITVFRGPSAAENQLAGQRFGIAEMRVAMTAALPARLGARAAEAAERLLEVYVVPERIIVIPEMVELLRELQTAGVPTGVLSNGPQETLTNSWVPLLGDALPGNVVLSGAEGVGKPEAAAFEAVANALGVATAECVFIDDTQHHVDGARAVGMHSLLFEGDAEVVRGELLAVGLLA